jgi:uncharacterized membrane protein
VRARRRGHAAGVAAVRLGMSAALIVAPAACRRGSDADPPGEGVEQRAVAPAQPAPKPQSPPPARQAPIATSEGVSHPSVAIEGKSVSFRVEGVAPGDVLNMRSAPDAASALVAAIPADTAKLEGWGAPTKNGSTTWQQVRYGQAAGWVNARFLKRVDGTAPAAAPPAAAKGMAALTPLICFGNEPFWAIEFGADGSATCGETCDGPSGLHVVNVQSSPSGALEGFDLLTAGGDVYLRAVMDRTGKCSDGMSDARHPYMFSGVGKPGPLEGCCRVKAERAKGG